MFYLQGMALENILLYRFALSLLCIVIMSAIFSQSLFLTKIDLIGGAALCCYYCLATTAFALSSMIDVAFIVSTTPLFVMTVQWLRGSPPTPSQVVGAVLASIGTVLVISGAYEQSNKLPGNHSLFGLLCALGAALTMSGVTLISTSKQANAISVNFWAFLFGALASTVLVISNNTLFSRSLFFPSHQQWLVLTGMALLSTLTAGMVYKQACQLSGSTTAAIIRLSTPLFAALLSWVFLGQGMSLLHGIGAPFVLAGIYLVVIGPA